jgi:predicted metal-dependent enzyme (double-stranded beta helix superfamily)
MTTIHYALDQFVADMSELTRDSEDPSEIFERGSSYLAKLIENPEAIPEELRVPTGRGTRPNHGSYALHRSPGLFVSSVVWGPGDFAAAHDHQTWGMIGVVKNGIQETRFRRLDDRSRADYAQLEKDRESMVKPGEISLLVPDEDEIHEMLNPTSDLTVEIHVYGQDLVGLGRHQYDLKTGAVKRWASGKFDNC